MKSPAEEPRRTTGPEQREQQVDDAVEQSFPASDPPPFSHSTATPDSHATTGGTPAREDAMDVARATAVDELLRGERAAADAYQIALRRLGDGRPERRQLEQMMHEHGDAISMLVQYARAVGADPSTGAGAFGIFARTAQRVAGLLGRRTALRALRAGELHGLRLYRSALSERSLPADLRRRIETSFVPRQVEHIRGLDALLEAG